jgi:hypothetical protein
MPNEEIKKTEEELKKEEFYKIKNLQDEVLYTTNAEELTEVLVGILATGSYTKTFSLFNGKIELTYSSITEKERMSGYDLIRTNADANVNKLSQIQLDAFNAKVNIALQLTRIKTNGNTTNLSQGKLDERVILLSEMPEEQIRLLQKYLMIFANITNKAFSSEEYLKNS